MPPVNYSSIVALEDNTTEIYMSCTEVLLRIARNILKEPENPRFRSLSLGSNVITSKLLPASGAMQCLFDMGFQEGSDKLIFSPESSLDHVKYIHDELIRRRELRTNKKQHVNNSKPSEVIKGTVQNPVVKLIESELGKYIFPIKNKFFSNMIHNIVYMWKCENPSVQLEALKCVPLPDLKKNVEKVIRQIQRAVKKKEIPDEYVDSEELLLLELCKWFKTSFYQWVNNPECSKCGCKDTKAVGRLSTPSEKKVYGLEEADSVEVYTCSVCSEAVLFPRYSDASKLLETRRGRCGEWARCFYLICRSLGWDVRYVVDETDHVWIEFYSDVKKRWIHCDPCETAIDTPLVYECGWNKNLSYIIAYSKDEIQDVTWRYSSNYVKVLKNRKECPEDQLADVVYNIRNILLGFASERRREFVTKRAALELVELMVQKTPTDGDKQGRTSGSLAWRLARGEIRQEEEFKPFVWTLNGNDTISYCTSSDEYVVESSGKIVKGWRNGLYKLNSIFRKEESDWKVAYIAREEGRSKGTLSWRFETADEFVIGDIKLKLMMQTFETGRVITKLCNDSTCVGISKDQNTFITGVFKGSKSVELSVELSGGRGETAWQHAQLLRQPFGDLDKTFQITVTLIRR